MLTRSPEALSIHSCEACPRDWLWFSEFHSSQNALECLGRDSPNSAISVSDWHLTIDIVVAHKDGISKEIYVLKPASILSYNSCCLEDLNHEQIFATYKTVYSIDFKWGRLLIVQNNNSKLKKNLKSYMSHLFKHKHEWCANFCFTFKSSKSAVVLCTS